MDENNNGKRIKVNVSSPAYWNGPIEVEMDEKTFKNRELRVTIASPQIRMKAPSVTIFPIDRDFLIELDATGQLIFERVSEVPREGEQARPAAEAVPEVIPQQIDDGTQQTLEYGREKPESARHQLGI